MPTGAWRSSIIRRVRVVRCRPRADVRALQDKNGGGTAEQFRDIAEAYETLSDSGRRSEYDQRLARARQPADAGRRAQAAGQARAQAAFAHTDPFAVFDHLFGAGGAFAGEPPFARAGARRTAPAYGGHPYASQRLARPSAHPAFAAAAFGGFPFGPAFPFEGGVEEAAWGAHGGGRGGGGYSAASVGVSSVSTTSVTTIVNGVRMTRTTRTVRHPDGRVETTEEESGGGVAAGLGAGGNGRGTLPSLWGGGGRLAGGPGPSFF